jgi:hypothetical protein
VADIFMCFALHVVDLQNPVRIQQGSHLHARAPACTARRSRSTRVSR